MYEDVLGDPMFDNTFQSEEDALNFLDKLGFKVDRVPLFVDEPELNCFKGLRAEQVNALKSLGQKNYIWVLTLK